MNFAQPLELQSRRYILMLPEGTDPTPEVRNCCFILQDSSPGWRRVSQMQIIQDSHLASVVDNQIISSNRKQNDKERTKAPLGRKQLQLLQPNPLDRHNDSVGGRSLSINLKHRRTQKSVRTRERQHNVFLFFFWNAPSGLCLKLNMTWYPEERFVVEGLTALPFLITVGGPGGDRRQATDELGLTLACHCFQPTIQDDKCHHAMLICFPETTAWPPTGICWTSLVSAGALIVKVNREARTDKHFISSIKNLLNPLTYNTSLYPTTTVSVSFVLMLWFSLDHSVRCKAFRIQRAGTYTVCLLLITPGSPSWHLLREESLVPCVGTTPGDKPHYITTGRKWNVQHIYSRTRKKKREKKCRYHWRKIHVGPDMPGMKYI